MTFSSVTIIFSPYHVGIRDHRVGNGPHCIRNHGVVNRIEELGIKVEFEEIEAVDDFEGEIGRSFEVLRRTSIATSKAVQRNSFPLVLSGNCMATAGVAAGMNRQDLGFIYFDAHDDMDTPSRNTNGYLDAMGLSILAGTSWHNHAKTVPGLSPTKYDKFIYCGLRDVNDEQKQAVIEGGAEVIWGGKVDFAAELTLALDRRSFSPAVVHLDLDVLDETVGKVNGFESEGGLFPDDLRRCMDIVPRKSAPLSLTVCSFNPDMGGAEVIGKIGLEAILVFIKALRLTGQLVGESRK